MRKSFCFSIILFIASNFVSFAQRMDSILVFEDKGGLYTIGVGFDSTIDDSYRDVANYKLIDSSGSNIKLNVPSRWQDGKAKIKFTGVGINHKSSYLFSFKNQYLKIDSSNYERKKGANAYDDYENQRAFGWKWSAAPQLIQSDSTGNSLGDLGLNLSANANFGGTFMLNLEGNVSSKKDDPNNTIKLNITARTGLYNVITGALKIRPLQGRLQENTTQMLEYHDLSAGAITTFVIEPPRGFQPVFIVVSYDYANITQQSKEPFREGRLGAEVMWGFEGLIGKGTSFYADWKYWNRLSTTASYDPSNKKERKYINLDLKIPLDDEKCVRLQYSEGDVPPLYTSTTSVSLGLQVSLDGLDLFSIK